MIVIGFDPGVAPAAAVYGGPSFLPILVPPMGSNIKTTTGKSRNEVDIAAVRDLMRRYGDALIAIEKIGVMPNQGLVSSGRFMYAAGLLEGIAIGLGLRIEFVTPQAWHSKLKVPMGDDTGRIACLRLFPGLSKELSKKNSHNQAEALLIAKYVWDRYSQGGQCCGLIHIRT